MSEWAMTKHRFVCSLWLWYFLIILTIFAHRYAISTKISCAACADPESCVRLTLLVDEGRENPNTTINVPSSARQRNTIEMAFCWRANDGATLNAGLVALRFQGTRTSIAKKPFIFVIFQGGGGTPCPPLWIRTRPGSYTICKRGKIWKVYWSRESI